jgi:hypothetical protein
MSTLKMIGWLFQKVSPNFLKASANKKGRKSLGVAGWQAELLLH